VAKYLATVDPSTLPPATVFSAKGRATPDGSALGEGHQVIVNGAVKSIGGTSASCPAFAAMISLLNEARLNAGKPAMGFLNPFLYENADCFTDVTLGSNRIGRMGEALPYGYNCSAGW
jgi:tripeptidyl-peptidase-1